MSPEEVMELQVQLPGLQDYSAQPAADNSDPRLVDALVNDLRHRSTEPELSNLQFLSSRDTLTRLRVADTRTARILFGPTKWRFISFDASGEVVANRTRTGLYKLLTPEFAAEIQEITAEKSGAVEAPYPPRALHEALSNAVAHAAYFEEDGGVAIELHPHHLVVSNLCLAGSLYFANRWFSRAHKTVNSTLMELLRLAGHVDELGRGKGLILAESLRNGKKPPIVSIDRAGRFFRWNTYIYGGYSDERHLRLLERLRKHYRGDERKALMANALVHWRGRPVSEVRKYVDAESSQVMAALLAEGIGPIWYDREEDRIVPRRWVDVLISEGLDSKGLSLQEEEDLLEFARDYCKKFHSSVITSKLFRELAGMGSSKSEVQQTYTVLTSWMEQGHVTRVKQGQYRFVATEQRDATAIFEQLLKELTDDTSG